MTERLATLLRDAADSPEPLQLRDVEQRVRRNQHRRATLAAAVAAALVAAVVVPLTVMTHHGGQTALTAAPPDPAQTLALDVLTYRQVSVAVPPGWRTAEPSCYIRENIVAMGPASTASCPVALALSTGISVAFEGGDNAAYETAAVSARWAGQPAVETVTTQHQRSRSGEVDVTVDTVVLPLMHTVVTVQAPAPAAAAQLLERVSVHPATTIGVPADAPSLVVAVVATSQPSLQPDVATQRPTVIRAVLSSLRVAPPLPVSTPICDADASRAVALLTIEKLPAIQVRLGFGCDEIVAGNGTLFRATPQLKAALAVIVGSAALD